MSNAIKSLNPYLFFDGQAAKAIALYQRVLGAKVEGEVMRWGQMPDCESIPPEQRDRVMHAMLRIGGGVIMLSDSMGRGGEDKASNGCVHLECTDVAETTRMFDALAATGRVLHPLGDAFFGAKHGVVADELGVHWMFTCMLPRP